MISKKKRTVATVIAIVGAVLITAAALAGPTILYTLGVISLLVAVALFTGARVPHFLGSVVGAVAFLFGVVYLVNGMINGPLFAEKGSDLSKMNVLMFFLVFGLPGAAFALATRFGYRKDIGQQAGD